MNSNVEIKEHFGALMKKVEWFFSWKILYLKPEKRQDGLFA